MKTSLVQRSVHVLILRRLPLQFLTCSKRKFGTGNYNLLTLLHFSGQICKDKDEAEIWFVGLKALITRGNNSRWRTDARHSNASSDGAHARTRKFAPAVAPLVCCPFVSFCCSIINFDLTNTFFPLF